MKFTIGEEMRRFRFEFRRSQGQLGVMVGKSQRLISVWERGLAKPSAEMIAKIRRAMKIVRAAERAADEARKRVLAGEPLVSARSDADFENRKTSGGR